MRALLSISLAGLLAAQTPGPQVLTFLSDADDSDQPYALYLPKDYVASRQYPLVVSLHGAGSNHRLNLRRVFGQGNRIGESDPEATRYFPPLRDVGYIVVSPLARGTMGYQGLAEKDVYDTLSDVKRRFSVDEDRVFLTGLSMGGGGTLWLGLTRPGLWAALAPVCPAPPPETFALAGNALNLPVHLFHGEADPVVPVDASRRWHKEFLRLGVRAEYIEYPDVRHNSWDNAYRDGAIFEWFSKFRRNRYPDRVTFTSDRYKYSSAYWLRIDRLETGVPAAVDARFTGLNQLEATTSKVEGFSLRAEGHPRFAPGQPFTAVIDGTKILLQPGQMLAFQRRSGRWVAGSASPPRTSKREGAEGPFAEAFSARHLYVYGTADNPSEEELARRRMQAAAAAEWSSPRFRLLTAFRVVADREAADADLRGANLILFGTKSTNRLIPRMVPKPPLELNPGAADYGLAYIVHNGDRYVVVSSGLPWWTGIEQANRPGLRFLPNPIRAMLSFGDFVLFRGSLSNIIAEGRFTESWTLPSAAAAAMRPSGAVVLEP